jgi:formylglycine-generating enzyme required for sulfatase activity
VDGKTVHVNACRISLAHVTIDQYIEFMDKTGYVPEFDRSGEYDFRGSQISTGGRKAGQWPVTSITLADAVAYAEWIGCRLPSEAELYALYKWKRQQKKNYIFGTECWTSTPAKDSKVIVLNQPIINRPLPPIQKLRSPQPPDNNDYPFMSFRVVKEAAN